MKTHVHAETCTQIGNNINVYQLMKVKSVKVMVAYLCATLCDAMDCRPSS